MCYLDIVFFGYWDIEILIVVGNNSDKGSNSNFIRSNWFGFV